MAVTLLSHPPLCLDWMERILGRCPLNAERKYGCSLSLVERDGLDWTKGMDSQPDGWLSESGTMKRGRGRDSQDKEHGEEPKTVRDKEHGESPFAVITYGLEGDNSNSS